MNFSATALSAFHECAHRTLLDLAAAEGAIERPGENEIERRLLEKRGAEHEARALAHLEAEYGPAVAIRDVATTESSRREVVERTRAAMTAGARLIYQGALGDGDWFGRPDFLIRSGEAPYHYEVADAKLARHPKARAVLQLSVYSDHLGRIQSREPERFWLVPSGVEIALVEYRLADYAAYYRRARAEFESFVGDRGRVEPYPEPVDHCDICPWWKRCADRRRADDHLSLVAGATLRQRGRLAQAGVGTVTELGALPRDTAAPGIGAEAFARIREQARIQVAGRGEPKPIHELFDEFDPGTGLEALPIPKPGDLFLDLEGDAFVGGEGLDYLFGVLELGQPSDDVFETRSAPGEPRYLGYWAANRLEEKAAFEAVIDRIERGREEFRDLHVFHFGEREKTALQRLSCRHRTREAEVDALLREHVLVDLYSVVRHALRASVESYSLKQLEALYDFERTTDLRSAAVAMQLWGWALETGIAAASDAEARELRARIERYNEDDCVSTWRLRDWLEARRKELEQRRGTKLARPVKADDVRAEPPSESAKVALLLMKDLPDQPDLDSPEQGWRRLLGNLLEWHNREGKSGWWEYFRVKELPASERIEDRAALGGLQLVGEVRREKQSIIWRYSFEEQEHAIRYVPEPDDPDTGKSAGSVDAIEPFYIDLSRGLRSEVPHPAALIPGRPLKTDGQRARLLALGKSVVAGQSTAGGDRAGTGQSTAGGDRAGTGGLPAGTDRARTAAHDLIARTPPRCGQPEGAALVNPGEDAGAAIVRLALALDRSVLPVQGPPGSGKTRRAAEMIVELVRARKRIGVTGNSHEVIAGVLRRVAELAPERSVAVRMAHVISTDQFADRQDLPFELLDRHDQARAGLEDGTYQVIGGTSWAWSSETLEGSVDVLVIDEAGQLSLANAVAVAAACKSLVLFGDPAQLEQPQKGVHPPGADASALEHLLGNARTLPDDRGVFLPQTYRLHPAICTFTSSLFYEGRLTSVDGVERRRISGPEPFDGAGLRYVSVPHWGNTNQSDEEVSKIGELVDSLYDRGATFTDADGRGSAIGPTDILVVAPYNVQVAALKRRLRDRATVGTVDKFQGKQAPIVVYSMTSSSSDDAPRGLEFLYSKNRLNVATSRAQAVVVLVASPSLFKARCKTPRQMQLVNALCAYREMAR